ncbi:phenylphosphate carboxylase subunit delta [Blastopirellula marina]|uniref:Phenylphosphate carboxylase subunit delta n=1 Tax=Blastopirellula marina TaxID=124 RepID=A0A2S8FGI1_9BACT|nr:MULTISPECIES: HAD hydrolase family protein [Pirellulaceae]PQO31285.1 phenylphosphate carboxylase subunit delta [Blastopirellula marina]RCS51679.1 phenylphosphate carboxylase subunit delta [Bremerella cremea]
MNLEQRCQAVELLLTDVDGVLTDGGVILNNEGVESKQFHIRDGLGFKLWRQAGFKCGVITGRNSQVVRLRAQELNLDIVRQGITDKGTVAQEVLKKFNLEPQQLAFVGDDLIDLGAIRLAGLGIAVADAVEEVKEAADYVTKTPGGKGAIREVIEMILKAKKVWNDIIHTY